jgi:CRISPR-associated endonuclease/helicase Cas3
VADWIGSNQEFFKPIGNLALVDGAFDLADYFTQASRLAAEALEKLGWLGRADRTMQVAFEELFPSIKEPRLLQTAVAEIVTGMTEPSLLIVEAPMGEGKTEAGWYAASCWDGRGGQGSYVALPTMATSNQMFDRVGKFLEAEAGKKNLMLQHGKAALNDRFEKLKYSAQVYDDEKQPSAVVAEGWFAANKKHGLLAPYGVGTIDQALLAVLQTKHVFVRLFGLAGKCMILDEVHAYDAYMTTLMERLLRWLAAIRCPVVLLSATLPHEKRLRLLRAYAGDTTPEPRTEEYPRLTTVAIGGSPAVRHVDADPKRAQTVALGWLDAGDLVKNLRKSLAQGGCAVVIRNTVGLAQQTYQALGEALKDGGIKVDLFHARFPFGRRKQIEDDVLKWYGRTKDDVVDTEGSIMSAPHRPAKSVLVATQVVEQSLDLDFDLMISDVAPVDLILQRAGRLRRHARGQRPLGVAEPCLWVITPDLGEGIPDFGLSGFIYSPHVLFRSLLALKSDGDGPRQKLLLPFEIDSLVEQVYRDSSPPDSLLPAERDFWVSTLADHRERIEKEEGEAESRRIKKPQFRGVLARVVQEAREEDNPDLHPAHQALTRLTRPTVSLICLQRDDNDPYRMPHDNSPFSTLAIRKNSQGGFEDVARVMLGEVTSAHRGLINQLRQKPLMPREWKDVGLLCRHHLILFTEGKALVGPYELSLDNLFGLTITRPDEQGDDE